MEELTGLEFLSAMIGRTLIEVTPKTTFGGGVASAFTLVFDDGTRLAVEARTLDYGDLTALEVAPDYSNESV